MNKILKHFSLALVIFAVTSCVDEEKDPFQIEELNKGSYLALRGESLDNLADTGCADSFDPASPGGENFEIEADYLSDDPSSLARAKFFATRFAGGPRVEVKIVETSAFSVPSGERFPRASISIPLSDILNGLQIADPSLEDFDTNPLVIEADLELQDGRTVLSSSIVNSGTFESTHFYPAHFIIYCHD